MSNRHEQLHQYLIDAIMEIRTKFAEANVSEFRLDIECRGRTMGAPSINITYQLGKYYSGHGATGNNLSAVIDEAVRRETWNRKNDPAQIVDLSDDKDEI